MVKQISKRAFNKLEDFKRWNIIGAMRGPDNEASALKYHTTGVLRAAMENVFPVAGVTNYDDNSVMLLASQRYTHFGRHIASAANALGIPIQIVRRYYKKS